MELELRLTILAIGLIIIIMIYLWGIRHRLRETWDERHKRRHNRYQNEPVMKRQDAGAAADDADDFAHTNTSSDNYVYDTWSGEKDDDDSDNTRHDRANDSKMAETLANKTDAVINADRHQHQPLQEEEEADDDNHDDEFPNILIFIVAPKDKPFKGSDIVEVMQAMEFKLNSKGTWSYYQNAEIMDNPMFRVGHLKEPGVFDMKTIDTLETPGLMLFIQLPVPVDALTAVDRMIGKAGQLVEKLGGSICDDHLHKLTPQLISHLREQATEYDRRSRLRQSR